MRICRNVIGLSIFVAAIGATACADGGLNPAAPSASNASDASAGVTSLAPRNLLPDPLTKVKGTVSGKSGDCTVGLSFLVGGTPIHTDATTVFDDGVCEDIVDGAVVEVEGIVQGDGSILASKVEADDDVVGEDPNDDNDDGEVDDDADDDHDDGDVDDDHDHDGEHDDEADDDHDDDEGEHDGIGGVISGLAGACPGLTFNVGSTAVATDASTDFEDGSCSDLANGVKVEVEGTVQGDGSILATDVEVDDEGEDDDEGHHNGNVGPNNGENKNGKNGNVGNNNDDDDDEDDDDDHDDNHGGRRGR